MTVKKIHLKIKKGIGSFRWAVFERKCFLGFISYWSKISKWFYRFEDARYWMLEYPKCFNEEKERQYNLYNRVVEIGESKPKDLNGALSLSNDSPNERQPRPKPPPPPKPEPPRFQKG